jgi:hypothetical protein
VGDLKAAQSLRTSHREVQLTLSNHFAQSLPIIRKLCDRLAIVPRLPSPVINGECKMVGSYRAGHSGTQGFDSLDCCSRRSMLKDYAEPREIGVEFPQVR